MRDNIRPIRNASGNKYSDSPRCGSKYVLPEEIHWTSKDNSRLLCLDTNTLGVTFSGKSGSVSFDLNRLIKWFGPRWILDFLFIVGEVIKRKYGGQEPVGIPEEWSVDPSVPTAPDDHPF